MPSPSTFRKLSSCKGDGYHPDPIRDVLELFYPQIMTKIRFQLAPKPTKAQKTAKGKSGFVPVATRWIIERSNAWMERCKSLVKNEEAYPGSCQCEDSSVLHPLDAKALGTWIRSQIGSIESVLVFNGRALRENYTSYLLQPLPQLSRC